MISIATTSVNRLAYGEVDGEAVLAWSCPVPYFGQLGASKVATLGINPSNREFVDAAGRELDGTTRRFHTLSSLGLARWSDASSFDIRAIITACDDYFRGNPYDRWFRVLDKAISATGASYYSTKTPAAHLDLVPYATHLKWGDLRAAQRRALLDSSADLLGALLCDSAVELLVLNGAAVVREFEKLCGHPLEMEHQSGWDLMRQGSLRVAGVGYVGEVTRIGSADLARRVSIVGFNHNLQSSFGVTRRALGAIARWVGSGRST